MKMTVPGRLATLCLLTTVFVGGCCSEEGGPRSECQTINAQTSTVIIRDYEYDRFCFFDLGLMGDTNVLAPGDSITKFVLFMNLDSNHTNWPLARAHIDWLHPGGSQPIAGRYGTIGHSYPTQYVLFPTVHYLYFPHEALHIDHVALAYFMIYRHPDGDVDTVGTIYGDTLDLQLLKVQDPSPTGPLWDAEWKNIYNLRCREIVYDGFELKVYRGLPGDEQNPSNLDHENYTPYLQIFELDLTDATGNGPPDGKIDDNEAILDRDLGLMVFPDRFPFADTHLQEPVPQIYSAATDDERQAASRYYLRVTTNQRSRQIRLGRVNIVVGSEIVTLNGHQLTRGFDYVIDYDFGVVTLTYYGDAVVDPDHSVVICYKYEDCCP